MDTQVAVIVLWVLLLELLVVSVGLQEMQTHLKVIAQNQWRRRVSQIFQSLEGKQLLNLQSLPPL